VGGKGVVVGEDEVTMLLAIFLGVTL
jgi:hypothetical protein